MTKFVYQVAGFEFADTEAFGEAWKDRRKRPEDALGNTAQKAPDHVFPCRAVPEAADRHVDHDIEIGPRLALSAAAQREVKRCLLQPSKIYC